MYSSCNFVDLFRAKLLSYTRSIHTNGVSIEIEIEVATWPGISMQIWPI